MKTSHKYLLSLAILILLAVGMGQVYNYVLQSGTVTAGHIATWTSSGVIQDGGAVPGGGSGTVTSIATTTPITGGTITTTGTIACATCTTGSPTNHGPALGSATQAFSYAAAGTAGFPFISGGASADGAYTRAITTSIPSSDVISAPGNGTAFATTQSLDGTNLAIGSLIEVKAHGVYFTNATSTPLLQFAVNAGGTTSICATGSTHGLSISQNLGTWDLTCTIQINTTGSPGTAMVWGRSTTAGTNSSIIDRQFNQTAAANFTTGSAQTVSVTQIATMVSGQTVTLQSIYARVIAF